MASTIGTARGSTQGSLAFAIQRDGFTVRIHDACGFISVETGLNPTRTTRSSPLVMPPLMPPLWLVAVRT